MLTKRRADRRRRVRLPSRYLQFNNPSNFLCHVF
jgi:hypothetical protein